MNKHSLDCIQDLIEVLADVFRQEAQHEIALLLQEVVLVPVQAVSLGIGQVVRTIQLNRQARLGAEQVHLHPALAAKGYGQRDIQLEPSGCLWDRFQAAVKEGFRRTPGPAGSYRTGRWRRHGTDKQLCQRHVYPIANQTSDAG